MGLFKVKYFNIILYTAVTFCGCRCKDEGVVPPMKIIQNCYKYWPIDSNFQWIYSVKEIKGTTSEYLFDDTLIFLRDSNIMKNGIYNFHLYSFKNPKMPRQFLIGNYPNKEDIGKLFIQFYTVNYILYDVNTFVDKPPFATFTSNGKPIDDRYQVSYKNLIGPINTSLGKLTCVTSYYTFLQNYWTGNESQQVYMIFAENKGPVTFEFRYSNKDIPNIKDSSSRILYEIKNIKK